eukprot:TRINITY_DN35165_c0_g1_i1.p1 TRINITY_DN35165_c0_g1~~TRINITY_DN35165_c0_g1_i1.p1  ORF type:complete len:353 (+),score=47.97 TRINITY_DN35165_c0_g1_i1:47-1060(+)
MAEKDPAKLKDPTPVGPDRRLTPEQVEMWKENGYCLVSGLLSSELVEKVMADAGGYYRNKSMEATFGSGGQMEFPTAFESINALTISDDILNAVEQLIGADYVLSQSDVWHKKGEDTKSDYDHQDQRIHMDYLNHTLVHPPHWNEPELVSLIVYFSDADNCAGQTAVIPRTGSSDPNYQYPYTNMPGFGSLPWKNDRKCAEAMVEAASPEMASFRSGLYDQEYYANFKVGSVLFYRHDTWHRGTPLKTGTDRIVCNMVFKKSNTPWVNTWNSGWARQMYTRDQTVEKLVATASVRQRTVLGFPPPGHPYWNQQTLNAVSLRYGPFGFDPKPYETFSS